MRNKKTKWITLSVASVIGAATLAGGIAFPGVFASAETTNAFEYTNVFKTGGSATLAADKTDATKLAVTFSDGGNVALQKRDLALKWYNGAGEDGAGYFSFKFSLADTNFETLSIVIESASAWATKDEKTTNTVKFTNEDGDVSVTVNDSEKETHVTELLSGDLTLSLGYHEDYGCFDVLLNGTDIGDFVNVGANFAENTSDITPFKIVAEFPDVDQDADEDEEEEPTSVMIIKELNGQSFALNEDGKVEDNALPVVVINEEINGFMVGTQYSVTAEIVDVIDTSPSLTTEYYQYDPTDEEVKYAAMPSSNKYLPRTYYDKEDGSRGCVFEDFGMEYFSVRYAVADDIHTLPKDDDGNVKEDEVDYIELVWYADSKAVVKPTAESELQYIKMDRNENGPWYTNITEDTDEDGNTINVLDKESIFYKDFVTALEEATKDLEIGSDSYVYLPTMKGLIDDDNGYKNLKFTVSYKTETSTSPSTSSISSASDLKFSISKTGLYEFKIIASDKAGNPMQYYLDGKLVDVTTSNVWDIYAIPSFEFTVQKSDKIGFEDDSASDRKVTESLNSSYTMGSLDVTGLASGSYTSEYALFKIDTSKYNDTATKDIQDATLYSVSYAEIQDQAITLGGVTSADGDYISFYKKAYAYALANKLDAANAQTIAESLLDEETGIFTQIEEYDSRIDKDKHPTEWKKNNKYNWNASSASFTTAEEGFYMVLAVYSDNEFEANKAAGYKIVISSESEDVIEGETQWLKNNLVSVILFGVAGVMLILIIILLFVKPSDETLEEVDAKALKARKAKEKKKK